MKKLFLIPVLALFACVNMWAQNEAKIGDTEYATLKAAIDAAPSGATIELLKDVSYTDAAGTANLNINKSLTLDGKGYTISGYSKRSGKTQYATIWINLVSPSSSNVTVIFKDVKVINPKSGSNTWAIHTRGKIDSVAIVDSYLEANMVPFQVGGSQSTKAKITMINSQLKALTYYCVCSYNPYILRAENCEFRGWNALYFKGVDGSAGSRGTEVTLNNCNLDCPNIYDTPTNAFAMFVCEDDGISLSLNNCGMHAEQLGNQTQTVLMLSNWASKTRRSTPVSLTITGDNSYINGRLVSYSGWASGWYQNAASDAAIPDPCPLSITISGGTYPFNPAEQGWLKNQTYETEEELYAESNIGKVTIPEGYEVKEISTTQEGQSTTLYRVRKEITSSTALNVNDGQNETEQIKVEEDVTLVNDNTVAEYVEVTGSTEPESETVTVTIPEGKSLEVSNGLDVSGNAQVIIESGATLVVGEGGVISESADNIVIEASEDESAAFLLSPEVIVNTTPNATYKFKSKAKFKDGVYTWQRFGIPTFDGKTTVSWDNTVKTAIFEFNYAKNAWDRIYLGEGPTEVEGKPFQCYDMANGSETEIEYTFTGNLMGNSDAEFKFEKGWNYYANCYTAPVNIKSLVGDLMDKYGSNEAETQISATIYLYDRTEEVESWQPITWAQLRRSNYSGPQDIKPMQAFIMQLTKGEETNDGINYRDNVYNPLVGTAPAGAPAAVAESEFNAVDITVSNGTKSDKMTLFEEPTLSEEFDNGWDAEKFEDNGIFSIYKELDGKKWQDYATNDLGDQFITFETKEAGEYTMTFSGVDGKVMNLYDAVADILIEMQEGATYQFTAEAIKDAERFQINPKNAPSAIDNTEIAPRTTKYIGADGQLYIRRGGNVYTVQGQNVK